jgi:predicted dinucleotide-binding enzyme
MRLGIIGAGFIGQGVARLAVRHGDEVMVSNSRGKDTLSSVASDIGCQIGSAEEAADFANMVLVAVPFRNISALPAGALAGKVVLDANNYYPERDGQIAALDQHHTTTSEMLAHALPGAKVVKAFNAILAQDLPLDGRPAGALDRRALPIAGDDAVAKAQVAALLDRYGFDAVDAGTLAESWRFERAKPAYCRPLDRLALQAALAAAERDVELPHGSWRR